MTTATAKADGTLVPIWKDDAKQIVYGVVLEPDLLDSQGDIVGAAEIEKAAHRFLTDYRQHDIQHDELARPDLRTVESYIAPQDMTIGEQLVRKGSWVLATHIGDSAVWQEIVQKAKTGYSIGGTAIRVAKDEHGIALVLDDTSTAKVDTPTGAYAEAMQKAEAIQKSENVSRGEALNRVFAQDKALQARYLAEFR